MTPDFLLMVFQDLSRTTSSRTFDFGDTEPVQEQDNGIDLKLLLFSFTGMAKENKNIVDLTREKSTNLTNQAQGKTVMPFAELKIPKAGNYVNKPIGYFACARCSRSYMRKDSLQRHLVWECGKEPKFKCPYCPQRCKRKSHWQRHIRRQHRDKVDIEKYLNSNMPKIEID